MRSSSTNSLQEEVHDTNSTNIYGTAINLNNNKFNERTTTPLLKTRNNFMT